MQWRCTGGRYPGSGSKHEADRVVALMEVFVDRVVLRIDDDAHPERWEEFALSLDELRSWLESVEADQEEVSNCLREVSDGGSMLRSEDIASEG